ncbi:RimJ/RimL family protein N-acetyltransferase [Deinobacterium chartae]|uniref:RimJ/RimL family protein N-acetyltransferase n=1 Tax=Deinobacterium chartae TaxID=521158 RepID=A0A841I4A9_9DEIO|nr:GNAT family protein [Deinobacterium chartae]MBB6099250.1 RimJ/RimL family protein N-acetyltransferase [Deinobacterium chartae]
MNLTLPKPTLRGERVLLRPFTTDDLEAYLLLLTDPEGLRLTGTQASFTREQTEGWLAKIAAQPGRYDLAITLEETGELIGEVVVNDLDGDNRLANLRVGLRAAYTGRGYGTEAMRLMIAFAFEQIGLHRLELEVFDFNPRAQHVYEHKLGFRREGVLRDVLYLDGRYHSAIVMSLLEDEYRASKAAQPQPVS